MIFFWIKGDLDDIKRTDLCIYLKLLQGETTTGTSTAVVLDSGAPNNRSQLVDWARGDSGSLSETGLPTTVLATGLY